MKTPLDILGCAPFTLSELSTVYPHLSALTDKARLLMEQGRIIRLKQGLYICSEEETGQSVPTYLVANHLCGPSYVSFHSALRYYGLTPEGVYVVQSMTTRPNNSFTTPIGTYTYRHCKPAYFSLGVSIIRHNELSFMMATPEKALCDLMAATPRLSLRYRKDMMHYLEEDIRFEMDELSRFNISLLKDIAAVSPKPVTVRTLINFLTHE